jgi:hypothetical protein
MYFIYKIYLKQLIYIDKLNNLVYFIEHLLANNFNNLFITAKKL